MKPATKSAVLMIRQCFAALTVQTCQQYCSALLHLIKAQQYCLDAVSHVQCGLKTFFNSIILHAGVKYFAVYVFV